ncbi:Protein rolling stone [Eumeta japonica]|uniref:Protein rolling stone n=1 Tax=Eumeta variegata TaxID=151549 RepID=A0A4C1ZGR2_EUMVA|nr:Protein rolling stone [Eumeta japonica]
MPLRPIGSASTRTRPDLAPFASRTSDWRTSEAASRLVVRQRPLDDLVSSSALEAVEYAPNPVLDVAVHAINSVLMLVELAVAAHPSRLAHFYHPLAFGLVYLLFGVIYYLAGGLDPSGNPYIYPVIDWTKPGQTTLVVLATALFLLFLHVLVVALAAGRDALARRRRREDLARRPGEDTRLRSENAAV